MNATDGISSLSKLLGSLKVNESKVSKADDPQGTVVATGAAGPIGAQTFQTFGTDQASVSAAGGLASAAATDGDVRLAKVAQLQQAIASGSYQVSAKDVADKIVDSLLSGR